MSIEPRRLRRPELRLAPSRLFPIRLQRLEEHEASELSPFCASIKRDHFDEFETSHWRDPLLLPKVFVAAEALFGRSSRLSDTYKRSFRFPLLLSGQRDGRGVRYVTVLEDVSASVNLRFFRLQRERVDPPGAHHPPFDDELSRRDLNEVSSFVIGYLFAYAKEASAGAPSFFRTVSAELLVYGKRRGDLFARSFDSPKEFHHVVQEIDQELRANELGRVDALLDHIQQGDASVGA